jgi:hypothetical protein
MDIIQNTENISRRTDYVMRTFIFCTIQQTIFIRKMIEHVERKEHTNVKGQFVALNVDRRGSI